MQSDHAINNTHDRRFYLPCRLKIMLANARDQKLLRVELSPKNRAMYATIGNEWTTEG